MDSDLRPAEGTATGSVTKSVTEARQGVTPGVVRWVLGVSLALAVVGIAIAFIVA